MSWRGLWKDIVLMEGMCIIDRLMNILVHAPRGVSLTSHTMYREVLTKNKLLLGHLPTPQK